MRDITATALTKVQTRYGTEPIFIVAIHWDTVTVTYYTTKDYTPLSLSAKVLDVSSLDNVIAYNNKASTSISIIIDDTDDTIRTKLKTTDIHKKKCEVFQVYTDLDWADRILLFKGKINSPIVWHEGDRTLKFDVVSEVEGEEVGFSPEEGQFDFVSTDMIGKPWPLGFGHVVHVPATRVRHVITGELRDYICFVDPIIEWKIAAIKRQFGESQLILDFFGAAARSADAMSPSVVQVIQLYCAAIVNEDTYTNLIVDNEAAIEFMEDYFEKHPARRTMYSRDIENEELAYLLIADLMVDMSYNKEYVSNLADICLWCHKVKTEALQQQIQAIADIHYLFTQYVETMEEYCRQSQYFRTEIQVANGDDFPQLTNQNVIINNVKWTVQFDGTECTYVAGPLPVYTNLTVNYATRPTIFGECGHSWYISSSNMFWLTDTDRTKLIKGMYCLVHSRFDNSKHIIRVIEQDGKECKFELIAKTVDTNNPLLIQDADELRQSISSGFPTWPGPFGRISTSFGVDWGPHWEPITFYQRNDTLEDWILKLLCEDTDDDDIPDTFHPVNKDELEVLLKLQKIYPSDIAMPWVMVPFPGPRDLYTVLGEDIDMVLEVAGTVLPSWLDGTIPNVEIPDQTFWEASPGDKVIDATDISELYVVNILPSKIKAVHAYRKNKEGKRILTPIPSQYYHKNEKKNLGDITVTTLKLYSALSLIPEDGWEDTVYVTYNSTVGPNVVDILEHIILTYTDKSIDEESFDYVKAQFRDDCSCTPTCSCSCYYDDADFCYYTDYDYDYVCNFGRNCDSHELYPANFVLFDRKNALQQLNEIAWQARCSLKLANETFYLTYLAEDPTPTVTLTESDIELATLQVSYTGTENLLTKMTATWKDTYLPLDFGEEPKKVVIRYNLGYYDKQEEEIDFYIYNIEELVRKSATFWMCRMSNNWKLVELKTHVQNLELETLDYVNLHLYQDYVVDIDPADDLAKVKAVVEEAVYDPKDNTIILKLWLPVRAGEMEEYYYVWPAALTSGTVFPPVGENRAGSLITVQGTIV
jgi:hypothetical protein